MEPVVIVRFTKMNAPYNAGEIAGFSIEEADPFIKRGVAVLEQELTIQANKERGVIPPNLPPNPPSKPPVAEATTEAQAEAEATSVGKVEKKK